MFGPTGEENYSKKLSTKANRKALCQALSLSAKEDQIIIIESLEVKSGKTSELAKLLGKINTPRRTLIVSEAKTPELVRASKNLKNVDVVSANFVNVYDVINSDHVVMTKPALDIVTKWLEEAK